MSIMTARHTALEQFAMAAFAAAAVSSFASSQKAPFAWVFLAPCAVAPFWRITRLPPTLVRWLRHAAWAVLGATLIVGLLHRSYPILSDEAVKLPSMVEGTCLSLLAAVFLLGSDLWPPATTLLPATVGILLIAASNPYAPHLHELLVVSGAAMFIYLLSRDRPQDAIGRSPSPLSGQFVRAGISGIFVFLIAWGIIQILPWLQVRVVQATTRLVVPQVNFFPGLSQVSRLGDLEELHLSRKVVMRVWTSRPQKLRGQVYTQFDGKAWHAAPGSGRRLMPAPEALPSRPEGGSAPDAVSLRAWLESIPGNSFFLPRISSAGSWCDHCVRTTIIQEIYNGGMLATPGDKSIVRLASPSLREDRFENLSQSPISPAEIYGVVNSPQNNVAQENSGGQEMLASCLVLPADTDPRLKAIAQKLKTGADSPAVEIQRTLNYIQGQCHYSLKVGKFHSAQPVAEFLFKKKRGYCEYFASAAAVLLRLEGVPTRYVTGFNVDYRNLEGNHYVIREDDAHAWIESYIAGKGWVEVDPTPEAEYAALHSGENDSWWSASVEWLATLYVEIAARFSRGDWLATLRWIGGRVKVFILSLGRSWPGRIVILMALLLAVAAFLMRRRKISPSRKKVEERAHEPAPVPIELQEVLRRIEGIWSRSGFSRPASCGPLEHLDGIPAGKLAPAIHKSCRSVIQYYYQISFGGLPYSSAQVRELVLGLDQAEKTKSG